MSYRHVIYRTDEVSHELEGDINSVFSESFSQNLPVDSYFTWKYRSNPLGNSYHLLTYNDEQLIAVRAFWRVGPNSDDYQCVDTCVLDAYRGRGVFKESTLYAVENIAGYFYNAPNSQSFPQYLKYGWRLVSKMQPKFYYFLKIASYAPVLNVSPEYISWRYARHPFFKYRKLYYNGAWYLFRLKKGFPVLVGRIKTEPVLPNIKTPLIFLFVASYDVFPGSGFCFGSVTNYISNKDVCRLIDPHWMDML